MRIRGEPNPTRRLEAPSKDQVLRTRWDGNIGARPPVDGAAATPSASGSSAPSLPVERVSVQPGVSLSLPWGEEPLEAYLQVVVEPGPGLFSPGTSRDASAASGGQEDTPAPQGGSPASGDGQILRLVLGLSPPRLGPVQVVLRLREEAVSGEVLVADAAALRAVEQALPQLKESLGRWLTVAGLKVHLLAETGDRSAPPSLPPPGGGAPWVRGVWGSAPGGLGSGTGGEGHGRLDLHA